MRSFSDSWSLILGEVNIVDGENEFVLMVGYAMYGDSKNIYVRLYTSKEELVFGKWISGITCAKQVIASLSDSGKGAHCHLITDSLVEKIKEQAARLEQLKVFA
jgi:hypothetical protein